MSKILDIIAGVLFFGFVLSILVLTIYIIASMCPLFALVIPLFFSMLWAIGRLVDRGVI